MSGSPIIISQLNDLADKGVSATIQGASFGWATLLRYQPLLNQILLDMGGDNERLDKFIKDGHCCVFEIGKNCGDVFSANLVERIEITSNGALIKLKRR